MFECTLLALALGHGNLDVKGAEIFPESTFLVAEIEDITGLNPGTLKSRLHRGRTRLKEALERWLDDRVPKEVSSRRAAGT